MSEQSNTAGNQHFYVITNSQIYSLVTKLDGDMKQLKHTFYLIGLLVMPVATTVITLIINNAIGA